MFGPIKNNLRYGAIRIGLEAGALGARLRPVGGRGLVFTLHHVRPPGDRAFDPNAILSVTPQFLDVAVRTALACGLTPVHLHDLPRLLADRADKRNFVAFSLDDGYRDNLEHAAPVFRKHGAPFTIFVTAGFVERSRTIWWETAGALVRLPGPLAFDFGQGPEIMRLGGALERAAAFNRIVAFVKEHDEDAAVAAIDRCAEAHGVSARGIVEELVMTRDELRAAAGDPLLHFGAHTVSHVNLTRVGDERLEAEIAYSAEWTRENAGYAPRSFAYPYGWTNAAGPREFEAARRFGFGAAVTTRPGVLRPDMAQAPTAMPRVSLNGFYQKERYVRALICGLPFQFA